MKRSILTKFLLLFVAGVLVLSTGGIFDCGIFFKDPALPEITYGEFPFRIEYEIMGERFVIEDTVICEFDGIFSSEAGKKRQWKSRLASGNEGNLLLLYVFDSAKKVTCNVGQPQYYMGDIGISPDDYWPPEAFLREGEGASIIVLFPEQWYDEYNFRFISWEFTDPIVNTFTYY